MSTQERVHDDAQGMRAALRWSQIGRGWTSPRPSVGCALVHDGVVIGGGHTQPGDGNPHAEVMALRAAATAGLSTQGATAYVTLEPCSHWRTTPPCSDALIAAGIKRVVCGVRDPNPCVDGRGFEQLRAAGVEVVENFMVQNVPAHRTIFSTHHGSTANGDTQMRRFPGWKIATSAGQSQWITGEASRRHVHRLRHEHDAVLVGIDTVLADDPQLSVRLEGEWKQPARVVLDSRGRIPLDAKVCNRAMRVLVSSWRQPKRCPRISVRRCRRAAWSYPKAKHRIGRVTCPSLEELYDRGIYSVLIEGGAHIAGARHCFRQLSIRFSSLCTVSHR
jgi:diaminohydroxyphosphoribosylaminopyrimidine deaminase/5-amino-6-(5-phosphoribosylamino)uracil reductase